MSGSGASQPAHGHRGQAVELTPSGENMATLFVPGKGSIDIRGENRIAVIKRLVDAHNNGPMPMATKDLVKDIAEDQSLANIFKQPLWDKLKANFLRNLGPKGPAVIAALLSGIAASPWMRAALRYGVTAFAILLFLLALRRSGERAGRLAEQLETTERSHDAQRRMLEAAVHRPRSRDDLAERLRDGRF